MAINAGCLELNSTYLRNTFTQKVEKRRKKNTDKKEAYRYRGWAKKNETTLVHPTAATVQDKIKWISLKCSQRLRK